MTRAEEYSWSEDPTSRATICKCQVACDTQAQDVKNIFLGNKECVKLLIKWYIQDNSSGRGPMGDRLLTLNLELYFSVVSAFTLKRNS